MSESKIEWTDRTWNPIRGCTKVSPGCDNCYAMGVAHRFSGPGAPYEGLTRKLNGRGQWNGKVRLVPEKLDEPLRWRKPSMVFVNSMSDLFHESVPDEYIAAVFGVMAAAPRHTFQILTKRPERASAWFEWVDRIARPHTVPLQACIHYGQRECRHRAMLDFACVASRSWPLPNVWLGTSAEDQKRADERIPLLLETPAAVRWVSAEPLLGAIDFTRIDGNVIAPDIHGIKLDSLRGGRESATPWHLNWIVVGGESGRSARECRVEWIESIAEQCREAGVACFVKQLGARPTEELHGYGGRAPVTPVGDLVTDGEPIVLDQQTGFTGLRDKKGGDPTEWPEHLRVREFPL